MGHHVHSTVSIRIRIHCGEDIAMGLGKASLLEAIAETGSISAAGRKLSMSYRKAWLLVTEMNRCYKRPLVETAKGGTRGGGACLSDLGRDALARYKAMQAMAEKAIAQEAKAFRKLLVHKAEHS